MAQARGEKPDVSRRQKNTPQTHRDTPPGWSERLQSTSQETTGVGADAEKGKASCAGGSHAGAAPGDRMGSREIEAPCDGAVPLPVSDVSQGKIYPQAWLTAALPTVAKDARSPAVRGQTSG